jgi:hypothetical protein
MHGEMLTKFQSENLKGTDHLGHMGVDGRIILKWVFRVQIGKLMTGFIWLRTGTNGGLL